MTETEAHNFARSFGEKLVPVDNGEFGDEQIALRYAKRRGDDHLVVIKGGGENTGRFLVCELVSRGEYSKA